jgi:hypothetical protein
MTSRAARSLEALLLAASLLFIVVESHGTIGDRFRYRGDAEHLRMAWNLWHFGVMSSRHGRDGPPPPNWRREPLYPALLAGVLALRADPVRHDFDCLAKREEACRPVLRALKGLNVAVLLALSVAAAWSARVLLGAGPAAWLAWLLVVANGAFWSMLDELRTETAAALALLGSSTCLYRIALGSRRARDVAGAGLGFGALVLLKAIFFYVVPALFVLPLWLALRPAGRPAARRLAAALALACAVAGAWVARNAYHGAGLRIGEDRAVLAIRAEYDTMSWAEWRAAWLYYARDARLARRALERWFEPADYARLRRENPDGFYRRAKANVGAAAERAGYAGTKPPAAELEAAARAVVLEHLPMHVALTGPLAVQGFFFYDEWFGWWPLRKLLEWTSSWLIPALLAASAILLARRDPARLAFFLPSLACFGLHAFATHNIPRYSLPLIPCATLALIALPAIARGRLAAPADQDAARSQRRQPARSSTAPSAASPEAAA